MKSVPMGVDEGACHSCGRRVFWLALPTGKVPLDAVAPTYHLHITNDAADPPTFEWRRANQEDNQEPAFVSHFATCTHADHHSQKGKR